MAGSGWRKTEEDLAEEQHVVYYVTVTQLRGVLRLSVRVCFGFGGKKSDRNEVCAGKMQRQQPRDGGVAASSYAADEYGYHYREGVDIPRLFNIAKRATYLTGRTSIQDDPAGLPALLRIHSLMIYFYNKNLKPRSRWCSVTPYTSSPLSRRVLQRRRYAWNSNTKAMLTTPATRLALKAG